MKTLLSAARRLTLALAAVAAVTAVALPFQAFAQPYPFDAERDLAPAATPKPVVARLHDEVQKALKSPEVQARMTGVGGEVIPGSQEMVAALIHSERQRYEKLVREANIKAD